MKTTRKHGLDEREMELVKLLMADCGSTVDIQTKLKKLFAGTIEQMLEVEMDEHLGYEKNSIAGNNSGNSRKGNFSDRRFNTKSHLYERCGNFEEMDYASS